MQLATCNMQHTTHNAQQYDWQQKDPRNPTPITIFPQPALQAQQQRNVMDLTIEVTPTTVEQPTIQHGVAHATPQQAVADRDLEMLHVLGHGAGGTVFRAVHRPVPSLFVFSGAGF
jgi:hypothetical protein